MDDLDRAQLNELLEAVSAHLEESAASAMIVVVGGSTLAVRGWVERTTKDVDVIAQAREEAGVRQLISATPLSDALVRAISRVARDYGLPDDWMNTAVGAQWDFGLPPGFAEEVEWQDYGALEVGFAGKSSLIALKLFAVVDSGVESVHLQDLLKLEPNDEELRAAATWVAGQDAGPQFRMILEEVLDHVRRSLGRGGGAG